jgi:hypothetical protein
MAGSFRRRPGRLAVLATAALALVSTAASGQQAGTGAPSPHPAAPTQAPDPQPAPHGSRPSAPASPSWSDLLREHLDRHPLAEAADVYKFVHQSVYGPAHAVPSPAEARRWLDEEVAALPPGPAGEPLAETLSHDPPLVRLNLRPYLAAGGELDALVRAFAATAAAVEGDPAAMRERLAAAVAALREAGRGGAADALAAQAAEQAGHGYPALHHSPAYRAAYAPAYRVVDSRLLAPIESAR